VNVVRTQDTLDPNESIEKAYPHGIRVVRVDREDDVPLFRFEAPDHRVKDYDTGPEFESRDDALMYAAVYVAVGPFREEKTGRRGVPPTVARAGREALVAYLTTQRGMSIQWAAHKFDIEPETVYKYRSAIRAKAEEVGRNQNEEGDK
jgi:hypothetical protein